MQGRRKINTDFTKEMLKSDYKHLNSTIKIANKYGVSKKTILNYMDKFGIQRDRKTVPIGRVKELAQKGLTAIEIGNILGFTNTAISKIGRSHNIDIIDKYHPGYITTQNGYIMIHKPDHPFSDSKGYVREHRLVLEEYLGRYLEPDEIGHHCDGNKKNNSIDNLDIDLLIPHSKKHRAKQNGRGPDKKPRKKATRS